MPSSLALRWSISLLCMALVSVEPSRARRGMSARLDVEDGERRDVVRAQRL